MKIILKPGMAFRAIDEIGNNYPYVYLGKGKTEDGKNIRILWSRSLKKIIISGDEGLRKKKVNVCSHETIERMYAVFQILDTDQYTYMPIQKYCEALRQKSIEKRLEVVNKEVRIVAIIFADNDKEAGEKYDIVVNRLKKKLKILVACEESQEVCKAFRAKGHEAYSCDIIECSGGKPEWHIMQDVTPLLNGKCSFKTTDGKRHTIVGKWDMIIAFPPCTHLAVSGAAWFDKKRNDGRQFNGIDFFCKFFTCDCEKVAIENPVNIISGNYILKWFPILAEKYSLPRKPTQKIHPWQFGDEFEKTTCLWLKGLPNLMPTNIVGKGEFITHKSGKRKPKWFADAYKLPPDERSKIRSKTFPGIAKAMSEQWG